MKTLFGHHAVRSDRPMTVYRVMPIKHIVSGPHSGFMSTTVSPKWGFAASERSLNLGPREHAILRLHVPAGTPHLPLENPGFGGESEFLFNHGTHLHIHPRVTSVNLVRTPQRVRSDEVVQSRTQSIPVYHGRIVHPGS